MTQYICISNKGEIEEGALTLLGASSKEGDNSKIGYFGTGLKYAIAFFLREGIDFKIYSGMQEIEVTSKLQTFRDQHFDVVHINGNATSITTSMGKDWHTWQALREIYCNALDEPNGHLTVTEQFNPEQGLTQIYIEARGDVKRIISANEFPKYFCLNTPVRFTGGTCTILEKTNAEGSANIFRKGIRVHDTGTLSVYDYNMFQCQITEDRTIKYLSELYEAISETLASCTVPAIISKILPYLGNDDYLEHNSFYYSSKDHELSYAWGEACAGKLFATPMMTPFLDPKETSEAIILCSELYQPLVRQFKDIIRTPNAFKFGESKFVAIPSIREDAQKNLKVALAHLHRSGFAISYPVDVVHFVSADVLGMADTKHKKIYISEEALLRPIKDIMITLIEEQIHIQFGCKDYTRAFMDRVLLEFVSFILKEYPLEDQN